MTLNVHLLHSAGQAHCANGSVDSFTGAANDASAMNKRTHQPIFLKGWRKYRHLTQERLAERMDVDRTVISKIERGQVGYTQGFLEAAAQALSCTPGDLLVRDPSEPGGIWSIWDQIPPSERDRAREVLMAFVPRDKTGT